MDKKCLACGRITKFNDEPSTHLSHGLCGAKLCEEALFEWSELPETNFISLDEFYFKKLKERQAELGVRAIGGKVA